MSRKIKNPENYQICTECKTNKNLTTGFYMVKNNILYPSNRLGVCKVCLKKQIYNEDKTVDIEKFKNVLQQLNLPYLQDVYDVSKSQNDIVGDYFRQINSMPQYQGLTWNNSMNEEVDKPNNDKVQEEDNKLIFIEETVVITEEDKKIQQDVMKLLGYDPFIGYSTFDQKFLYGELIPYLDEETLEDQYKVSVILQILNNNNQIRKIDLAINNLSSNALSLIENDSKVKSLTAIKSQIAKQSDNLSKENGIAVKHRGDKKAGRSTLGFMMKDLRELTFNDAEENFYDMETAHGMQMVADISNKSILSQLNFDEKDIDDMFKQQRDYIKQLENANRELEEKIRLLSENLIKLQEECNSNYISKGSDNNG